LMAQRAFFDDVSLNVISFLESHKAVTNVKFHERVPASSGSLTLWHQNNAPYSLPNDYQQFLLSSDGLLLRWDVKFQEQTLSLGCMHLNSLSSCKPLQVDKTAIEMSEADLSPSDAGAAQAKDARWDRSYVTALDLDSTCMNGRVALLYKRGFNNPQVWFQDLSCKWNFIADTFTDYFRLMVMHLGLPHWQYSFTDLGMDRVSQQWFRLMSPERLSINLDHQKSQGGGVKVAGSVGESGPVGLDLDSLDRRQRPRARTPRKHKPKRDKMDKKAVGPTGAQPRGAKVMAGNTPATSRVSNTTPTFKTAKSDR